MKEVQSPEKCIKDLIPTYTNKVSEIKKLMAKFERKKERGLWWDSKVPEQDKVGWKWNEFVKRPYKNVSWSGKSDKSKVNSDLRESFIFYQEVEILTQEIDQIISEKGIGAAESKINLLSKTIEEAIEKAEKEKDVTKSSTVYNSHLDLISVQSKVVSDLKSIHWDASRRQNFDSENKLAQGVDLNQEYKQRYCDAEERNRKLEEEKQVLKKKNQVLKEKNQVLEEMHQKLAQKLEIIEKEVATIMQNVTIEGVKGLDNAK